MVVVVVVVVVSLSTLTQCHCSKLTTKLGINISVLGMILTMHTTIQSEWRAHHAVNSS